MPHEHIWQYLSYVTTTEPATMYKFVCHCGVTKQSRGVELEKPLIKGKR